MFQIYFLIFLNVAYVGNVSLLDFLFGLGGKQMRQSRTILSCTESSLPMPVWVSEAWCSLFRCLIYLQYCLPKKKKTYVPIWFGCLKLQV